MLKRIKNIELPIDLNPKIRAYLNHAYVFGIISGANFGDDFISRLICDKYINCIYCKTDVNQFYIYEKDGWFENCGLIKHNIYVCEDAFEEDIIEAIKYARKRIKRGAFLFCRLNAGHLYALNAGNTYDYDHEYLIWGFNDNLRVYKSIGYINGKYTAFDINYKELEDALINLQLGYIELNFYKVNRKFSFLPLNIEFVCKQLKEYLESFNSDFCYNENLKQIIANGDLKFGISVWKELINYINLQINSKLNIDMRYIRSFMDNKYLMYMRIKYLSDNNYLKDKQFLNIAYSLYKEAKSIMILSMKYNLTYDLNILDKLVERIHKVNLCEEQYLLSVYNNLCL